MHQGLETFHHPVHEKFRSGWAPKVVTPHRAPAYMRLAFCAVHHDTPAPDTKQTTATMHSPMASGESAGRSIRVRPPSGCRTIWLTLKVNFKKQARARINHPAADNARP